jgi:predicted nucleic acid-binding protein
MASETFLLDTCVISQAEKAKPNPAVASWLEAQTSLAIPYPVLLEVETGHYERSIVAPHRGRELRAWIDGLLQTEFVYPAMTPAVARLHAEMLCCRPLKDLWFIDDRGKKKPSQDLSIASISIHYQMPIASLDGHFQRINRYYPLPGVYDPALEVWTVDREHTAEQGLCFTAA